MIGLIAGWRGVQGGLVPSEASGKTLAGARRDQTSKVIITSSAGHPSGHSLFSPLSDKYCTTPVKETAIHCTSW